MRVAFGIELDGADPIVIRAERRRGGIRFRPAELDAARGSAADAERGRVGLAGALPAGDAVLRRLSAPMASIGKARRVFPTLLEEGLPFSLEQCIVCVDDLVRDPAGGVSGLGMAALRERVWTRRQAFAAQGIQLTRMDHAALALWRRSVEEAPPADGDEARLVVCVSADRLTLAMGRGDRIEAAYGCPRHAGSEFTAGAHRAVRGWCAAGDVPVRVLWAGADSNHRETRAALDAAWADCAPMRHESHADPEMLLARGMAANALRRPGEGGFLRGEAEPAAVRVARELLLKRACIFALAAGMMLAAGSEVWRHSARRVEDAFRAGLNARAGRVIGGAVPIGVEAARTGEYARTRRAEVAPLAPFFQPSLLTAAAWLVNAAQERGARIERLELNAATLRLHGRARDWEHPEHLAGLFEQAGFPRPEVQRSETDDKGWVPFVLEGRTP